MTYAYQNMDNNHFESIAVYECKFDFDINNKNKSVISYPEIKTNKKDGALIVSSTYKIINKNTKIIFEISQFII